MPVSTAGKEQDKAQAWPLNQNFGDNVLSVESAELLTVEEVAFIFKVPKSWVYERTRRRGMEQLPFIKLGKYLRFEIGGIQAYLARNRKSR